MNNNLNLIKVFLFIAAVLSALAAVYTNSFQKIAGFTASTVCFISFLILMFSGSEENENKEKYNRHRAAPTVKDVYREEIKAEYKPEIPQFKPIVENVSAKAACPPLSKEELNGEKIKVLNKFASVASHDLKNPLSSLKNIAYYFTNSVKIEGDVPNKMLRMLGSEVDRMNNMIVDLLDSTRVKQLNKVSCDLNALINDTVEKQKQDNITFDVSLQQLQIYGDPERLKQVFSSIIRNAKEAMPEGGTITLKTYKSANEAVIEISDTGTGMDADTLAKCFDPMFSTKIARALGMSLTVSKQIINMHDGRITAESTPGKGSKFTITLPLVA